MILFAILIFFLNNSVLHFHNTVMTVDPHFSFNSDSIVNGIRIKEDVETNTFTIQWLKHFKRLHITVTRIDGRIVVNQTYDNSDNGELHLIYLIPAFYFITVQGDNELPNHTPILQRALSTYKDEE